MNPTQALAALQDLIAKIEEIPADVSARDFRELARDIIAASKDVLDLYEFCIGYFPRPTGTIGMLSPGASPLAVLQQAKIDVMADPAGFDWSKLLPSLLALMNLLLPFLRPTK